MPSSDSILLTLNLKEPNIHFSDSCVSMEPVRGVQSLVYSGLLTYPTPDICPVCGARHASLIRYGTKSSLIVLPKISRMNAYLRLAKQRWLCRDCGHTFSASSPVVEKNCFISENTKLCAILDSKQKRSQKDIAGSLNISHGTVNSLLLKTYSGFLIRKNYLPRHLCFDEFRSVKSVRGKMSFLIIDAQTGSVIDLLEDRLLNQLIRYFSSYSRGARCAVQTVCMDLYSPYSQLVHAMFPNARIIIDRFHIIQLISRSLNQTRVDLMKQDRENYRKLKRYWRIVLKNEDELDDSQFHRFLCFPRWMRETDVAQYLVHLDPVLLATYELYQELLHAIKARDPDRFFQALRHPDDELSGYMKISVRTLLDNETGVRNALIYPWSNGVIEGTNNLIKVIKRIAFGYRSFVSFKIRILLVSNTLVRLNGKRRGTFLCATP